MKLETYGKKLDRVNSSKVSPRANELVNLKNVINF